MKNIRTSKFSKIVASYLAIQMIVMTVQPSQVFALTGGPSQPEFNAFTPIGTSDMVNLSSGDFNYNIPIMDVGGYPLNLAYNSGVTMDQEASWVGLGWNLNVGQINRQMRGLPDDFKGDSIRYENKMRVNRTVGMGINANAQLLGFEALDLGLNGGLTVQHNNYDGISFSPSLGFSLDIAEKAEVGMSLSTSATEGVTVSPSVKISAKTDKIKSNFIQGISGGVSAGVSFNSRQGLSSFNMNASMNAVTKNTLSKNKDGKLKFGQSGSGSISFVNNTFTPIKRNAFNNKNFTFAFSGGPDLWGIDVEGGISAFGSEQKLADGEDDKYVDGYGYEFSHEGSNDDVLDFNRENDRPVSKNTLVMPITNYTHDLYSIQGQGIGGMFRPFRSQSGYVYDTYVQDVSSSTSLGGEWEGGTGWHVGVDIKHSPTVSSTGVWNTDAKSYFENSANNHPLYEPVYFQSIGELSVDDDLTESNSSTFLRGDKNAIALDIEGNSSGRRAVNVYREKTEVGQNLTNHAYLPINGKIKRTKRAKRNQSIQKISVKEAIDADDAFIKIDNQLASNATIGGIDDRIQRHHTAGYKILKPDGSTYIFGEAAYNWKKVESTFNVGNQSSDCTTGLVNYSSAQDSNGNGSGIDNYFNRVTTPSYVHTYLLNAVVSSDYEDLTGDGPTDDDLGAYTKFNYTSKNDNYKWRVPYESGKASYNEGLKTLKKDQKGSYVYGEKELKYIRYIETKTHIAVFDLNERNDGYGVSGNNGGYSSTSKMYQLKSVTLFSKPELTNTELNIIRSANGNVDNINTAPIKVAHFQYDYSLCQGVKNNPSGGSNDSLDDNEQNFEGDLGGKLTLRSVYFTYKNSHMGEYTPYVFNYDMDNNPAYGLKDYDVWGNYLPNNGGCGPNDDLTAPEFPYVQQEDRDLQNNRAKSWSLKSIELPSGGTIDIEYESDDYQYVQDRKAMEMFKVVGVGGDITSSNFQVPSGTQLNNTQLYNSSSDARYLYVKLRETEVIDKFDFIRRYLGDHQDKPIYFRFLVNMTNEGRNTINTEYDFVTGYFKIAKDNENLPDVHVFNGNDGIYAAIAMESSDMEGGTNSNRQVNPISKSGWYFGRNYMNKVVYGLGEGPSSASISSIANQIKSHFQSVLEIFGGPNGRLRNTESCARRFEPGKSWIRLQHADNGKLGGGLRVTSVKMKDNWDKMVNVPDNDRYKNQYGQTYSYELEEGGSSGVATFEPNLSKENPFVEPFYDNGERLVAPREVSYVEKPFGVSFFPSPTVTYSRVTVKNLIPDDFTDDEGNTLTIKKHATGKVINEFYTSKDFPTIADHTSIGDEDGNYYTNANRALFNTISSLAGAKISTNTELTLSQGFVVRTNDMNGKSKKQQVYNESGNLISGVDYRYATNSENESELDNRLKVISKDGSVSEKEIGVQYEVINDFRESYSRTTVFGVQANVAGFIIGIFPIIIPMGLPERAEHTNIYHGVSTTKVIHTTGVLKEKIAYDLGSRVSTKNLAWDEDTGEILLTETTNEYDDLYYNLNFPAQWNNEYANLGRASRNLDFSGRLLPDSSSDKFSLQGITGSIDKYLRLGDELATAELEIVGLIPQITHRKLWVVGYENSNSRVILMDRDGQIANSDTTYNELFIDNPLFFKVIRSGYRNMQMSSMASVTLMKNPLMDNQINADDFTINSSVPLSQDPRIINASAIQYNDFWDTQCEANLPKPMFNMDENGNAIYDVSKLCFNPYVYNVKGDYRAEKSYAYLTGRRSEDQANLRHEGFFTEFSPYYTQSGDSWTQNLTAQDKWTFASRVTKYSPYGAELENADALGRYSSAQYGYNYTLPVAVSSNSSYEEMGYDGFEDYNSSASEVNSHFGFQDAQNLNITSRVAHSGYNSIVVGPNTSVSMVKTLEECGDETVVTDPCGTTDTDNDGVLDGCDICPTFFNPSQDPTDSNNNDIPDECERIGPDETITIITGPSTCQASCNSIRLLLSGAPNQQVTYDSSYTWDTPPACFGAVSVTANGSTSNTITLDSSGEREVLFTGCVADMTSSAGNNFRIIIEVNMSPTNSSEFELPVCDDVGCGGL